MGVRISWETVARNCTGSQGAEMCIVVSLWNWNIYGKRLLDLEAVFLHKNTRSSTYNCWKCVKIYLRFGNRSFICQVFQLLEHPTILLHLVDTVSWCMQHVSNQEPNHKNTYSCWYGCPGRKCIFIVPVQGTTAWNLSLSLHDDLGSFRESQNQEFMEAKKSHRIIQWQWQQQIWETIHPRGMQNWHPPASHLMLAKWISKVKWTDVSVLRLWNIGMPIHNKWAQFICDVVDIHCNDLTPGKFTKQVFHKCLHIKCSSNVPETQETKLHIVSYTPFWRDRWFAS